MITTFEIYLTQITILIIISFITGTKNTYTNIASNSIISIMAGGTLLYEQRIIGFLLLIYGIFLMSFSIKEYETEKYSKKNNFLSKLSNKNHNNNFSFILKILGHYLTVSLVLIIILFLNYQPELTNLIKNIFLSIYERIS